MGRVLMLCGLLVGRLTSCVTRSWWWLVTDTVWGVPLEVQEAQRAKAREREETVAWWAASDARIRARLGLEVEA